LRVNIENNNFVIKNDVLIKYNGTASEVVIPEYMKGIEDSAFKDCKTLNKITFLELSTVIAIKSCTFQGCSSLKSIKFSDKITSIGESAFEDCSSLTGITLPQNIKAIRTSTFKNCTALRSISIPKSVTQIEKSAFENCVNLKQVHIYGNDVKIASNAFKGCCSIEYITANADCKKKILNSIQGNQKQKNKSTETVSKKSNVFNELCFNNTETTVVITDNYFEIDKLAFSNLENLKEVIIPESVFKIGNNAFAGCLSLTSVNIPNSVTKIANGVFKNCKSLKEIQLPSSITEIAFASFKGCESLESIMLPVNLTEIGKYAFEYCFSLTEIIIPKNVKKIYRGAFQCCVNLKKVTILSENVEIGEDAFAGCDNLQEIIAPFEISELRRENWGLNKKSEDLEIDENINIESIKTATANNMEQSDDNLYIANEIEPEPTVSVEVGSEIILDNSLTVTNDDFVIEDGVLVKYTGIDTEVVIPDNVSSIANLAFNNCNSVEKVTISTSINQIGTRAFSRCENLETISILTDYVQFGMKVFASSKKLKNFIAPFQINEYKKTPLGLNKNVNFFVVTSKGILISYNGNSPEIIIPYGINIIGYEVFLKCETLEYVEIPNGITEIHNHAFACCNSLQTIIIPDTVTFIGDYAFSECESLTSITLPENLTHINKGTFFSCSSLKSMVIPSNVVSIGNEAFASCSALEIITIPESVTEIGEYTFVGCNGLEKIEFLSDAIEIAENAFEECTSLREVILPSRNCNIDLSVFPDDAEIVYRDEIDKKSISDPQPMFNGMKLSEEEMALILKLRSDKQKAQEQEQNVRSEFSKTDDEYTAINSPLVLKDCSRIISNNIFTLRFSCASGASQYSDSEYEIFLADGSGNAVSSIVKYEEEPSRIEFAPQFELNSGVTFNKNEDYYLTITELNNGKSSIISKNKFHVDITFSQDFDF